MLQLCAGLLVCLAVFVLVVVLFVFGFFCFLPVGCERGGVCFVSCLCGWTSCSFFCPSLIEICKVSTPKK